MRGTIAQRSNGYNYQCAHHQNLHLLQVIEVTEEDFK